LVREDDDPENPLNPVISDFGASTTLAANPEYKGNAEVVPGIKVPNAFSLTIIYAAPEVFKEGISHLVFSFKRKGENRAN
jgi:hypothetical protein